MRGRPDLDRLLFPRSVAVIGAGREGLGRLVLDHLARGGFRGAIWAVHPTAERIGDLPAFPRPAALPSPPDLAVVALPRDAAVECVVELAGMGCGAAVVVAAGFAESGAAGLEAEAAMVAAARRRGMRVLGPNCMGLVHTHPRARLHAAFGIGPARAGPLAVVSQSGAIADFVLYHAAAQGLGLSLLASVGNEADVTLGELLLAAGRDRRTRALACYVEEPSDPEGLLAALSAVAARKPVVVLKGARSRAGAGAAASHTGRLALSSGEAVEALIAATGAILVRSLEDLLLASAALLRHPAGSGPRTAVLTNAGGPAVLAVDAMAGGPLEPVGGASAARRGLARLLPGRSAPSGPVVDLTASAMPGAFGAAARCLAGDADALLALVMSPEGTDPTPVVEALAATFGGPMALALLARGPAVDRARALAASLGLPVAAEPATAVRCLESGARRRQALAQRPRSRRRTLGAVASRAARALLRPPPAGEAPAPMGLADALTLVASCGVPVAPFAVAADEAQALEAALELGRPVFLKVDAPGLLHRSEARAVAGPCRDSAAVRAAARRLCRGSAFGRGGESSRLVVQAALRGVELLLGCARVGRWGLVGLVGRGGLAAEAEHDVVHLSPPFDPEDAVAALRRTRTAALLGSHRGEPPADLDQAGRAAAVLVRLASAFPFIYEIELSPFVAARGDGPQGAVDARIVLGPGPSQGERPGAGSGTTETQR